MLRKVAEQSQRFLLRLSPPTPKHVCPSRKLSVLPGLVANGCSRRACGGHAGRRAAGRDGDRGTSSRQRGRNRDQGVSLLFALLQKASATPAAPAPAESRAPAPVVSLPVPSCPTNPARALQAQRLGARGTLLRAAAGTAMAPRGRHPPDVGRKEGEVPGARDGAKQGVGGSPKILAPLQSCSRPSTVPRPRPMQGPCAPASRARHPPQGRRCRRSN